MFIRNQYSCKYGGALVLISLLMLPVFAQCQESDFGNWLVYFGNKKIDHRWNIHNEIQYRNYNVAGDLEQLLLRTGIGFDFNDNKNNVLIGYGFILSENYNGSSDKKASVNEHRVFQQFISKQKIGNVAINHRYRFEQRFIESDFKLRARYFLGLNIPLFKPDSKESNVYLSGYNEIFLNTKTAVFDRNRTYGGLGYTFNNSLKVELGYMTQFFETSSRDQMNILMFINF